MTTWCIFPVELISNILSHTDPRDVVRWRTVSKWFCSITYNAMLWKALYANVPFPRPPGPSPFQSTESLQRTLVKSAQLAQSWTTRRMRDVSTVEINLKGRPMAAQKLIHGRWFIDFESSRRFVLHDVNAGAETHARQVLWEQERPLMRSWDVFPMTSVEGQCVVYVLCQEFHFGQLNSAQWKLLEFRLNDQSGELYDSAAIYPPGLASKGLLWVKLDGQSPFLFIHAIPINVVFDTRTRVFYELPGFRSTLDEMLETQIGQSSSIYDRTVRSTNKYIISFRRIYTFSIGGDRTIIQVFTLPPDGSPVENGNPVLRLTHEGISDIRLFRDFKVLKSSVDPATGATNVKLLDYSPTSGASDCHITCIDLTLPKPSAVKVLPITIEMQHIGFPEDGALARRDGFKFRLCFKYIDVSDDGHARGFCRAKPIGTPYGMKNKYMRFTIDTTQDPWVITCGKVLPAEGGCIDSDSLFDRGCTFDGMRGRLCFDDFITNSKPVTFVDIE